MVENQPLEEQVPSTIEELNEVKEQYGDQADIVQILHELEELLTKSEVEYMKRLFSQLDLLAKKIIRCDPENAGRQISKILNIIAAHYDLLSSKNAQKELDLKTRHHLMDLTNGEKYNEVTKCREFSFPYLFALLNQIGPIPDQSCSPDKKYKPEDLIALIKKVKDQDDQDDQDPDLIMEIPNTFGLRFTVQKLLDKEKQEKINGTQPEALQPDGELATELEVQNIIPDNSRASSVAQCQSLGELLEVLEQIDYIQSVADNPKTFSWPSQLLRQYVRDYLQGKGTINNIPDTYGIRAKVGELINIKKNS